MCAKYLIIIKQPNQLWQFKLIGKRSIFYTFLVCCDQNNYMSIIDVKCKVQEVQGKEVEWYANLCKFGFANLCEKEHFCGMASQQQFL